MKSLMKKATQNVLPPSPIETVSAGISRTNREYPVNSEVWRTPPGRPFVIGNAFAILITMLLLLGVAGQASAEAKSAPLDLNQATSAQLEALPGIGAKKAAAILAVRDARGGFKSMDQLESVRGIGPALMTKLKPLLKIGKPTGKKAASTPAPAPGSSGRSAK